MEIHLLSSLIILLLIACIVAIISEWINQPYTIALVLVGLVVAILKIAPSIYISHDVTMALILPPLLFYGAMHVDIELLRKDWLSIVFLAVPAVVCSTFLIGYLIHFFLGIDLIYALLFGALITPTDPISVIAILGKIGAPKRLRTIIEGESLFNDGTGVVIFMIILAIIQKQEIFSFQGALTEFFRVTLGGTLVGFLLGFFAFQILRKLDDHLIEVALTVVLTFGTPLVAEHFHFSGVIAIVVAGLIIGNYGKHYSMSEKTREALDHFWEVIDFIVNSFIFLVIGIELQVIGAGHLISYVFPIALSILAVQVSRAVVVYPMVELSNRVGKSKIPLSWTHIMFWGGLKGSISLALVVGLPKSFIYREQFLIMAFSVVLFTLIVQGLSIKALIKKLSIS